MCLRCRADSYRRASGRQRALAARVGLAMVGAAVLAVAANGLMAARQQAREGRAEAAESASGNEPASRTFRVAQAGSAAVDRVIVAEVAPAMTVPAGRTDLGPDDFVERAGDRVTVHFDAPALRTRRRDKFESEVRRTLPAIFGSLADSVLAAVPAGQLAGNGDLLTTLPVHGIALPSRRGWTLTVWPGVRPGQDGPLVVSYRAAITRTP